MLSPPELWTMYESMADSNSLWTDIATSGTLNVASDGIAQATERSPLVKNRAGASSGLLDLERSLRFGAFGAFLSPQSRR